MSQGEERELHVTQAWEGLRLGYQVNPPEGDDSRLYISFIGVLWRRGVLDANVEDMYSMLVEDVGWAQECYHMEKGVLELLQQDWDREGGTQKGSVQLGQGCGGVGAEVSGGSVFCGLPWFAIYNIQLPLIIHNRSPINICFLINGSFFIKKNFHFIIQIMNPGSKVWVSSYCHRAKKLITRWYLCQFC